MTIDVKDAAGQTVAIQTPNANGRAAAAGSRPVALATEDMARLAEIRDKLDLATVRSADGGSTTAVIANGASLSGQVDLAAQRIHRIHVPAAGWTAADITFRVSFDGTSWADLWDAAGEVKIANAAAGRSIVVDQSVFYGVRWVQIRSGPAAGAVAQGAERTLTLVTVAR